MTLELCRSLEDLEGLAGGTVWRRRIADLVRRGRRRESVVQHLLAILRKGSVFRVAFGMAVMLDPRNEVVDPDADCLEMHPKFDAAAKDAERTTVCLRRGQHWSVIDGIGDTLRADDLDAAIDAVMAETPNQVMGRTPQA